MAGRKALISKDDLDRMACAVAAHGVVMKGCVDTLGNFTFTLSPQKNAALPENDDLDDRLDDWAAS
jgi:hypothetical protein